MCDVVRHTCAVTYVDSFGCLSQDLPDNSENNGDTMVVVMVLLGVTGRGGSNPEVDKQASTPPNGVEVLQHMSFLLVSPSSVFI